MKFFFIVLSAFICLYYPIFSPTAYGSEGTKLTVLFTNDHHGRFWKNRHGEYGMAARRTLIQSIRGEVGKNGGHVLLLSAGDINTGVPESDIQDAMPDFTGMNMIQYDAMSLGNHEFDKSLSILGKQAKLAKFPFLSANVVQKKTGKPLFEGHSLFTFGTIKVIVVGLTTEDTRKLVNPENVESLHFLPVVKTAKKMAKKYRSKADVLIALTHAGHYPNGKNGSNAPGDVAIARATRDYDLIVGGHSQIKLDRPDTVMGTPIVQSGEWGKWVGRIDLLVKNGKTTVVSHKIYPVNLKKKVVVDGEKKRVYIDREIVEDPELLAVLKKYQDKGSVGLNVVIGSATGKFDGNRAVVRIQETNLGNLIAVSQMEKTGANLAVMNSGGIRTDIEAGDVTYKDILKVQPFGNTICTVELTGTELKKYLETAVAMSAGSGAFAQFAGVEIKMNGNKIAGLKVNAKSVNPNQTYKLAVNNFIAAGGDGYMKLTSHPTFVNTGYVDADILREYFEKNSPVKTNAFAPTNDVIR